MNKLWFTGDKFDLNQAKSWFDEQNKYSDYTFNVSGPYLNFEIEDDQIAVAFRLAFDASIGEKLDVEYELSKVMEAEMLKEIDEEIIREIAGLAKQYLIPKVSVISTPIVYKKP
jgi:hypothetical protein